VYAELERAGILETCRGRGTFVAARPRVEPGARERRLGALCRNFIRHCSEEGFSLDEIQTAIDAINRRGK
jgi:DNA-binding transcriptional regulator YhcF (GntR family)